MRNGRIASAAAAHAADRGRRRAAPAAAIPIAALLKSWRRSGWIAAGRIVSLRAWLNCAAEPGPDSYLRSTAAGQLVAVEAGWSTLMGLAGRKALCACYGQ